MNKEQILIQKYGCKDLKDLKKCFFENTESLTMILEAMEDYAQQKVKNLSIHNVVSFLPNKGKYCNHCGDYVGKGCDNLDCEDFKG